MEPGASRLPPHVLGENEALQQFFSVLDSSVAVDTSVLEQYLSNDVDPSTFMLPESPPDSSSESCSPPQLAELGRDHTCWTAQREVFPAAAQPASCHFKSRGSAPSNPELLSRSSSLRFSDESPAPSSSNPMTYAQLHSLRLTDTYIKSGTPPTSHHQHAHHSPEHCLTPGSCSQGYTPPTPPSPPQPPLNSYVPPFTCQGVTPNIPPLLPDGELGSSQQTCPTATKKRRRSESEESLTATSCCESGDGPRGGGAGNGVLGPGTWQLLTWEPYMLGQWSTLKDRNHQRLPCPAYHVNTDKGFNFSPSDEAFVCQKKNHFQVTVHIGMAAEPQYVTAPSGPQEVDHFHIKVFGVKLETPGYLVTIEQSQPDRSKKPFHPVRVNLPAGKITKVTLGRLHFSETTANNMRKKGKPNPDQRYFQMVVGLYAVVREESFLLTALQSERIIVRASNPGQFEVDGETLWQRGTAPEAVVCHGRVGINTDSPDEALVVCGNAKVMGAIIQPSDCRAKQNIQEVDSEKQLKRINQMRIVEFDYKPEFASSVGIDHTHQTGVIAQEVKELLPCAVKDVGDVAFSDGETINNFLMVDKEQIFMENVGAVQQLTKLTDNLETRIEELEVWNRRLAKLKSLTGSLRSSRSQRHNGESTTSSPDVHKTGKVRDNNGTLASKHCLRNKIFQVSVFTLLTTMAFCVISITTLYLLTVEKDSDSIPGPSNNSLLPAQTTAWTSTDKPLLSSPAPTGPLSPWPPDVDFCDLLYCDEVYCCPLSTGGSSVFNKPEEKPVMKGAEEEGENVQLIGFRDWTNTTVHTFMIKESQQVIDSRYCMRDECGPGRYIFRVPISQFVPVNMRITLVMNSTELLVVHLCDVDESTTCSSLLDLQSVADSRYPSNTQGEHEWPLQVSRLYQSSYHFRSTVAGQADCNTDHHYAGALFTDYFFNFYRRCTDI
ncbi:myelin regulatory factor-like protein isoform X1 [Oryzias latipes]|uniref:myelin regulatory factor-like protein isoform X1 n=2 Tax=Oryzias latipes TaxID=8090 RepID=UPI000CE1F9F7|nr:myelin regulatory factor-like protein isoform X1 [Oryzias latipes]XP_023808279.1 myelin regulatory factor-like protein isoform X1 [Oryzias latipes]